MPQNQSLTDAHVAKPIQTSTSEYDGPSNDLELASAAFSRLITISCQLVGQYPDPVYGDIIKTFVCLRSACDREDVLRHIPKLLRGAEIICRNREVAIRDYASLRAITKDLPGSEEHNLAIAEVRAGLRAFASRPLPEVLHFLQSLNKFDGASSRVVEEINQNTLERGFAPESCRSDVTDLVYDVLCDHMLCICQELPTRAEENAHIVQLMLQPPYPSSQHSHSGGFDMLFSSAPQQCEQFIGHWQFVQLRVERDYSKRVRFSSESDSEQVFHIQDNEPTVETPRLPICKLIKFDPRFQARLTIRHRRFEEKSRKLDRLKYIFHHTPGISLAELLKTYRLSKKQKVALACIIAHSVWEYYESNWLKTKWSSNTIRFMAERECDVSSVNFRRKFFVQRPYASVRFDGGDIDSDEKSTDLERCHPYPRILSLGIMLIEIAGGSPLSLLSQQNTTQCSVTGPNEDLINAWRVLEKGTLKKSFGYPAYWKAVKSCFKPEMFTGDDQGLSDDIHYRKDTLYSEVVSPIIALLEYTGWKDELDEIAPLESRVQSLRGNSCQSPSRGIELPQSPTTVIPDQRTSSRTAAEGWLNRMRRLSDDLSRGGHEPVRIAILDTGYDAGAAFFQHPDNGPRLRDWKDWVEASSEPQDCNGHGTHLTSLVMRIAPTAHIFVARVAKEAEHLVHNSGNVSKAIAWATREWHADIISLSFGFRDEQPCISEEIRNALYERRDSVLFFAAAANHGMNGREMFPARHDSIISVRGTNANGGFEDFNPPINRGEAIVFGTLGSNVPSTWLSTQDEEMCLSGTSTATAIAAAIASVLLAYAASNLHESKAAELLVKLRKRKGMCEMFRTLSQVAQPHSACHYLAPWKLIGKTRDERWDIFSQALSQVD